MLSLIDDILEMSRIESGKVDQKYEPADLRRLLGEIGELFAEQMKQKGLSFAIHDTHVRDPFVWCDRKNLDRVLLNLVSNAYKFTPSGGNISVTLFESGSGENGYGDYELSVQDSGIGMSSGFLDKMFTTFERERSSTASGMEGTGLGLAITKNLVDLMGGTIEVLTSPGSGTQIIIRLKLKLADEADVPKADAERVHGTDTGIGFKDKRLLLVEDNMINMEIAQMILEQQGFTVETAENGRVALDMVSSSLPGYYDAILMDIQMPVMNGYAAARAIRALDDKGLAGIQAHVAKPIDVGVLMEELKAVFRNDGGS